MRLRRGKWKYKLPDDTHEILHGYLRVGTIDYSIMQVRPTAIYEFRKRDKEQHGLELYGYVSHVAVEVTENGVYLLTYPMPDKANTLKLRATRLFEI